MDQMNMQLGGLGSGLGTIRRNTTTLRKDRAVVVLPSVPAGDTASILFIYGTWCGGAPRGPVRRPRIWATAGGR